MSTGRRGLQYNRARWYDASIGRWISEDPIGFAGGDANLYRYVLNGPTYATDPSGQFFGYVGLLGLGILAGIGLGLFITFRHPGGFINENLAPVVDPSKLEVHLHSVRIQHPKRSADEMFERMAALQDIGFVNAYPQTDTRSLGDVIYFDMNSVFPEDFGQGDFAVKVNKLDTNRRFMSARTLAGHPLAGWRAWEVEQLRGGDIVIRTFSVEHAATWVDQLKLDLVGLKGMYEVWTVMLKNLVRFSGGTIVEGSPETILNGRQEHALEPYYSRVK